MSSLMVAGIVICLAQVCLSSNYRQGIESFKDTEIFCLHSPKDTVYLALYDNEMDWHTSVKTALIERKAGLI